MTVSKARKRPPGSILVQQAAIQQAGDLLQKLPEKPKENWSLREAIESLEGSIVQALDRGYSHEEVAELLEEKGISISVSSLKRYLAASRKDKGGQPRRTRKPRGRAATKETETEPTSVESVAPEAPAPSESEASEAAEPATTGRRKRSASNAPKASSTATKTKTRSASTRSKTTPSNGRRKKKED
ncbi:MULTISPECIES: hypothetical protein [unclassified Leptolyngbya]|uniref:hypothetical protein n=1 Tax=unclassified Leptolyngbya TaxID=2650499 RepID=UPI001683D05A|nr:MULTISPECIES: hypothetical protein [unclassified Leptolyngbya]MBD1913045.1 hypothetical protein [Leptolyngbya sp. FACHB-8]MBD2154454.1 hypothetical protein [Leptolyngbya sp. FACHB-16]